MPAGKAALKPAEGVEDSSIVTIMARIKNVGEVAGFGMANVRHFITECHACNRTYFLDVLDKNDILQSRLKYLRECYGRD